MLQTSWTQYNHQERHQQPSFKKIKMLLIWLVSVRNTVKRLVREAGRIKIPCMIRQCRLSNSGNQPLGLTSSLQGQRPHSTPISTRLWAWNSIILTSAVRRMIVVAWHRLESKTLPIWAARQAKMLAGKSYLVLAQVKWSLEKDRPRLAVIEIRYCPRAGQVTHSTRVPC